MHKYNYSQWIWLNVFQHFPQLFIILYVIVLGICNPETKSINSVKSFKDLSLNQIRGNNLFIKLKSVTHVMSINGGVVRINYGVLRSLQFSLTGHPPHHHRTYISLLPALQLLLGGGGGGMGLLVKSHYNNGSSKIKLILRKAPVDIEKTLTLIFCHHLMQWHSEILNSNLRV